MVKSRKGKGYYKRCYWFKRGSNKRVTTKRRKYSRRRYTRRRPYPKTTYFGPRNYDPTLDLAEDAPSVFLTPSMEAELPMILPPPPEFATAAKARRKSRKSKRRSKSRSTKRKSRRKSSKRRETSKRRRRY